MFQLLLLLVEGIEKPSQASGLSQREKGRKSSRIVFLIFLLVGSCSLDSLSLSLEQCLSFKRSIGL